MNDADEVEIETTMYTSEEVHGILMHWNPEEIRHYHELMWQQPTEQGKDEYNDKVQQCTYECNKGFAKIEDKYRSQEHDEVLQMMRRRSHPSCNMQLKKKNQGRSTITI